MIVFVAAFLAIARPVRADQDTQKIGQTCTAHSDCLPGLRCLKNVCVDEAAFNEGNQPPEERVDDHAPPQAFIAGALGASLPTTWGTYGEGYQLALRVGVIVDRIFQLQIEVAPSILTNLTFSTLGLVDAVGMVGILIPIREPVSWIARVGGGGGILFNSTSTSSPSFAFGEVRFDIVGVAIRPSKHVLLEFNAPSIRMMMLPSPAETSNVLTMWVTNVTFGYTF